MEFRYVTPRPNAKARMKPGDRVTYVGGKHTPDDCTSGVVVRFLGLGRYQVKYDDGSVRSAQTYQLRLVKGEVDGNKG